MYQRYLKKGIIVTLVIVLLVGIALFYFRKTSSKPKEQTKEELSEVAPSPTEELKAQPVGQPTIVPLAQGKQVYTIFTQKPRSPQIAEVTFDPLDAKKGETQTIIVKVTDSKNGEIKNDNATTAIVKTDSKDTTLDLKLIKVESQPVLTTIWQGSFILDDTNDVVYSVTLNTKNIFGTDTTEINIR